MTGYEQRTPRIVVGFWRRFFADSLDAVVLGVAGFTIGYALRYTFSGMGLHALWVGLACSVLYFGLLHTRLGAGQTPGKRLLGIQVLKRDGTFLSLRDSLIRYLAVSFVFYNGLYGSFVALLPPSASMALGAVFLLVVAWAFFACFLLIPVHPLKRGLHDLLAGSVVVYRGSYDAAVLEQMENPANAKRALLTLGGVTVLLAGLLVAGLFSMRSGEIAELSTLAATLGREYDVRGVNSSSFNGQQPILFVEVFLPLAQYDDKAQRERVRADVYQRVQAGFPTLEKYQNVRVVVLSGFNIGIANLNLRDG